MTCGNEVKQAVEAALRSFGEHPKINRQFDAFSVELTALLDEESEAHFLAHVIEEFLANGYSLERPEELFEAVSARLQTAAETNEVPASFF